MAPSRDPFLWDIEEVVSNFCHPRSPWTPDPKLLAEKVREEEIDGRLLLTSERTLSKEELMRCLGVTKFRHKAALAEELTRLQSESSLYRKWDRDFTRKRHMGDTDETSDAEIVNDSSNGTHEPDPQLPPSNDDVAPQQSDMAISTEDTLVEEPAQELRAKEAPKPDATKTDQLEAPNESFPKTASTEPPQKKRRVALTNISAQPLNTQPESESLTPWEESQPWSYLGEGKIPSKAIKSSEEQISTRLVNLEDDGFVVMAPNRLPPGRRLAVNRVMKQVLRKNGHREALAREGVVTADSSSTAGDEELDLANLSDLDEETWQEILEEEEDNQRAREQDRSLTPARVEAVIEEALEEMKKRWEEKKQPKYERKAHKIWNTAVRKGDKLQQTLKAQRKVFSYEARIKQLVDRIKDQTWKDEREVKLQVQCLEQSVEDKLHQLWLIGTLELRQAPPKPHLLPPPPARKETQRAVDPGDEVLTSTDEEDDFVVPDDLPTGTATPTKPRREHTFVTPVNSVSPMLVDLTQSSTRHREKQRTFIDLTTPIKGDSKPSQLGLDFQDDPPSLEDIDVEAIGGAKRKKWADENDRWRLAIYILRQLLHERRTAVLTRIMSSDDEELWNHCIEEYLGDPLSTPDELVDIEGGSERFDLTRTFLCFVLCRYMADEKLAPPKQKYVLKLRNSKAIFSGFCNFLRNIVDLFPQDSQIIDTNQLDEMVDIDDELSPTDDAASPHHKNGRSARKQVVQNREAVNLRERERQRGEEQEARRIKLRRTLATGAVAQDKTRLIINETKEEGQSLIYVNDEIGKQIKDHQIGGVRFLWNQIIQDNDIRQGCLLAHTMGLGKTMQVITFLVAIAEASASHDPATRSQIPEDLRASRTLILCPSGLVENWMDEILKWAPRGLLGPLRQLDALLKGNLERKEVVLNWAKEGGVLITGYPMFQQALKIDDEVASSLLERALVVVADEAHKIKSANSDIRQSCNRIKTNSRIALTGSPLANNVEEYYAMINWVAPNFLGPIDEFRSLYAHDIHAGCYRDSDGAAKRRAMIRLRALERTVAPKVSRATVKSCLMNDLPAKSEFVISLTPTALQVELYNMYIDAAGVGRGRVEQNRVFSLVNDLVLICNHPSCFDTKLQKVKDDAKHGGSSLYTAFPRELINPHLRVMTGLDNRDPSLSLKTKLLLIILDEARRVNDKVLIFSSSIPSLDYLEALLRQQKRRLWRLDGATRIQGRQEMTKAFNKNNFEVGLISTMAGGVGLNIQGANRVVIFDSRWNPVDTQQAVGRAYRIGQQKKVFVYHLVLSGTFEEDMQNRAVFKQQLAQRVVDRKNVISWSNRLSNIIHPVKSVIKKDIAGLVGKDHILNRLIEFRSEGQPNEQLITNIVSTDTFEEEDLTSTLTEGEKLEADKMVSMNRLRLTDPGKYEQLRSVHQMQGLTSAHSNPSAVAAPPPPSTAPIMSTITNSPTRYYMPSQSNPLRGTEVHAPMLQSMDGAHDEYEYRGQQNVWRVSRDDARQIPGLRTHHQGISHYQGTSNGGEPYQHREYAYPQVQSSAPAPSTGAHTYFGVMKPSTPTPAPSQSQHSVSRVDRNPSEPQMPFGNTFGQPRSPEKRIFESRMKDAVRRVQSQGLGIIDQHKTPEYFAQSMIQAIDGIRQEKQLGFLPDNQQWKYLNAMLDDDRFVMSAISGHISTKFLALSDELELQRRANTINGLTEEEFRAQMYKLLRQKSQASQDANSAPSMPREAVSLKSRREAADHKRRPKPLPAWAQEVYRNR